LGEVVTLGDALDLAGARIHGAAILLLALPESIPLPIPSFGAVLGIPLLIISVHLAVFGESGNLPDRVREVPLPRRMLDIMVQYLAGPLARAERMTRRRLPILARRERAIGGVCTTMSALLLLPVPLMNGPPALAMVFLSWGLLQRDGAFVGLGLGLATGALIVFVFAVDLIAAAVASLGP
jgi:hypothetical protein